MSKKNVAVAKAMTKREVKKLIEKEMLHYTTFGDYDGRGRVMELEKDYEQWDDFINAIYKIIQDTVVQQEHAKACHAEA